MHDQQVRPGDVLDGRYRVGERIGVGGMAEVHRAEDLETGTDVALKLFRPDVAAAVEPRRTSREGNLLRAVHRATLVEVLGTSPDGSEPTYLVMELVPGRDLGAVLRDGPIDAERARRVAADVADALATMHAHGLVHRDVKPANILVVEPDAAGPVAAKLTDLGIAIAIDGTRLTATGSILGTAGYLSPEQVRGDAVRAASDVYALGLVLIESLTGERTFGGGLAESAVARLNRPPGLPPDASPELARLLAAMTALDPAARPDARAVADALGRLRGGMTADEMPPTVPLRPHPLVRGARPRSARIVGAVAAVLLTLVAGLALAQSGPARQTTVAAATDGAAPIPAPAPVGSAAATPRDTEMSRGSTAAGSPRVGTAASKAGSRVTTRSSRSTVAAHATVVRHATAARNATSVRPATRITTPRHSAARPLRPHAAPATHVEPRGHAKPVRHAAPAGRAKAGPAKGAKPAEHTKAGPTHGRGHGRGH